ncbi:MAG: hypothetical protein ACP5OA_02310 [Candidatus Woesearchaeota archaeon]
MSISLKRKLYSRGGSFETTIPLQLLFSLDIGKKHNVIFEFDKKTGRWYVDFEEEKSSKRALKEYSKK